MGYTHYYKRTVNEIPEDKWNAFLNDVKQVACRFSLCVPQSIQFITDHKGITNDIKIPIGDGGGEGSSPEFTKDSVCFNGVGDDSHETLGINRVDGSDFDFCKTAHKPYDLLVTATLSLFKHHFGDSVTVSGDGGPEGFQKGLDLVNETLKLSIELDDIYPQYNDEE